MSQQAVPRKPRTRRTDPRSSFALPHFAWGGRQWEVVGVLIVALAAFTLVALIHLTPGRVSDGWANLLRWLFGWGAFSVPLGLGVLGYRAFRRGQQEQNGGPISPDLDWQTVAGIEIALCGLLAVLHAISFWADPWELLQAGQGGGAVGWTLATLVANAVVGGFVGRVFAALVFLIVMGIGIWLAFRVQLAQLAVRWSGLQVPAATAQELEPEPEPEPAPEPKPREAKPKKQAEVKIVTTQEKKKKPPRRDRKLPPLDLLLPDNAEAVAESEIKRKAALIEDTLKQFGLVGRVVEVSPGPAVTQFGVEPGYIERPAPDGEVRRQKVRVGQIASLQNDLALVLAASPLRIQAPVPGKSIVGIEVPNEGRSLVSLRGVLEAPAFTKLKSKPLAIAMGRDVAGGAVTADLATMPHALIAGTTGSGKSVCINAIITSLVMNNQPEDLQLVMIDPKMVELVRWNGLPHLLGKVETDLDRIVGVLRWVTREMDARYKKFAQAGSRNLADYNAKVAESGEDKMPFMVVLVDELADLMMMAPVEVEKTICRLAQMARATGIHLVLATQRPSTDVVTGLIKANFPARVSFAVASSVDSRVILDSVGAETLLGKGDMLYVAPDSGHPLRLQGCYVSDQEMDAVVKFWQEKTQDEEVEEAPWEQALATAAESGGGGASNGSVDEEDEDELLRRAVALVKQQRGASASLLQRKMRLGYPKAARLIDRMEEMGIIGPPEAAGRLREVLIGPDDEVDV